MSFDLRKYLAEGRLDESPSDKAFKNLEAALSTYRNTRAGSKNPVDDSIYEEIEDLIRQLQSMKLVNILLEETNELEAIKSKLEADQKNEHLIFTIDKDRDEIRVGGREGAKQDFVLRNEKEDFGSYRIFNVDDDDRGVIVRITKKK